MRVPQETVSFDFAAHLARQAEFSARTFGPGIRTAGVCDHIRKELLEIEAAPGDLSEWVDVIILALDGAWRAGGSPEQIIEAIVAKQTKNEGRTWPDWRTSDPNKAIEHVRGDEMSAAPACDLPGNYPMSHGDVADDQLAIDQCPAMHARHFIKVWADADGGDAGRIALAKYAFKAGRASAQQAKPAALVVPSSVPFSPTDAQFSEWCERHDMHLHLAREAFDDAASLYLLAAAPTPPAVAQDSKPIKWLVTWSEFERPFESIWNTKERAQIDFDSCHHSLDRAMTPLYAAPPPVAQDDLRDAALRENLALVIERLKQMTSPGRSRAYMELAQEALVCAEAIDAAIAAQAGEAQS